MKANPNFDARMEACRKFASETTKLAGMTKAIKELSSTSAGSEERYYFKSLLSVLFRQLVTDLNILANDPDSEIRIDKIVKDFEMTRGGRLKELGLDSDLKRERNYGEELKKTKTDWVNTRNKLSAHKEIGFEMPSLDIDEISLYLVSVCHILNTLDRTAAVPEFYPKHTKEASYTAVHTPNLEEESYKAVKANLKWHI